MADDDRAWGNCLLVAGWLLVAVGVAVVGWLAFGFAACYWELTQPSDIAMTYWFVVAFAASPWAGGMMIGGLWLVRQGRSLPNQRLGS
jgi:hypothetical protein